MGGGHRYAVVDSNAFEETYRSLAPRVAGYLRSQGHPDPDDGTNDVFLRVFRSWDRFSGSEAGLRSWVFTIAHNLVIDDRRFRARRPESGDSPVDRPGGDSEVDALAALGERELVAALASLPAAQRDVLLLRFVADLPIDEVAAATGRTGGAVKALQHRALASARRMLEREAVSP